MVVATGSPPLIVGGKLHRLGIERPDPETRAAMIARARAQGFALVGDGSIKRVAGSTLTIVVSAFGCTCTEWRNGNYCLHQALYDEGRAHDDA